MWQAAAVGFDGLLERYRWQFGTDDPALLDWTGTMRVRPRITSDPVLDARPDAPRRNTVIFGPPGDRLPNPDASVDVVVIEDPARLGEARRVARDAVFVWPRDADPAPEWSAPGRPLRGGRRARRRAPPPRSPGWRPRRSARSRPRAG